MKKTIKLGFLIIILLSLMNCQNRDISVNGYWTIDSVEYVEIKQFAPNQVNYGAFFDFKEDGQFTANNFLGQYSGTWEIDSKTISINLKNENLILKIDENDVGKMVLLTEVNDSTTLKFHVRKKNE